MSGTQKRLIQGALFLLVVTFLVLFEKTNKTTSAQVEQLFNTQKSGVMVEFTAQTQRLLPDDTQGSAHQKFIVDLGTITLLIAHNIDLAPRVPISVGDWVTIKGEYEWNDRGGIVHWTHNDPQNKQQGGWIELAGKKYQ